MGESGLEPGEVSHAECFPKLGAKGAYGDIICPETFRRVFELSELFVCSSTDQSSERLDPSCETDDPQDREQSEKGKGDFQLKIRHEVSLERVGNCTSCKKIPYEASFVKKTA